MDELNTGMVEDVSNGQKAHNTKPKRLEHFLEDLDEQWPSLKFLGFGAYYAWIWLCYNSTLLFPQPALAAVGIYDVYLASTTAVGFSLILWAILYRVVGPMIRNNRLIIAVGVVAMVGTLLTAWCTCRADWAWSVGLMGLLTGASTSLIALRLGVAYSSLPARRAVMYTASSFIFACMLYFVAMGLPFGWGLWFMAFLPLLAALMVSTSTVVDKGSKAGLGRGSQGGVVLPADQVHEAGGVMEPPAAQVCEVDGAMERPARGAIGSEEPPMGRSFLVRFVAGVGLYSLIVGITRAFPSGEGFAMVNEDGAVIVFLTALIAAFLFVVMGFLNKRVNIARLYSMAIVLTAAGILLIPVCEVLFFPAGGGQFFESRAIGIAYALFVLTIWCLCAHLAHNTGTSAIKIFGLGRGASALGTTLGWVVGSAIRDGAADLSSVIIQVSVLMGFVLFAVALLVLNEGAISKATAQGSDELLREMGSVSFAEGSWGIREGKGAHGEKGVFASGPLGGENTTLFDQVLDAGAAGAKGLVGDGGGMAVTGGSSAGGEALVETGVNVNHDEDVPVRRSWRDRCEYLVQRHGLSPREAEVLLLLGKGRTLDYIHNELGISMNTTKSHARNIYQKLGVHTRSELLDLIEDVDKQR